MVGLVVIRAWFKERQLYAPIDAAMLKKYRMFSKMGFFGVEKDTRKGAVDFLRHSTNILSKPNAILAVTAQGRFADVRERPAGIKRGLGHLSLRVADAVFIPACIEYVFWEEKLPEILVQQIGVDGEARLGALRCRDDHPLHRARSVAADEEARQKVVYKDG